MSEARQEMYYAPIVGTYNSVQFLETYSSIDMFKQHEILFFICYSTQKSDIGTVVVKALFGGFFRT